MAFISNKIVYCNMKIILMPSRWKLNLDFFLFFLENSNSKLLMIIFMRLKIDKMLRIKWIKICLNKMSWLIYREYLLIWSHNYLKLSQTNVVLCNLLGMFNLLKRKELIINLIILLMYVLFNKIQILITFLSIIIINSLKEYLL